MKSGCRLIWAALLALSMLSLPTGCASMDQARKKETAMVVAPPVEKPQYIFHRVMEGETLAGIAKWYAGDEALVVQLKEENPDLDHVALNKGDVVRVPVFLAVVHREQPDHSTQPQKPPKPVRKKNAKASRAAAPRPSVGVPEVFGPR